MAIPLSYNVRNLRLRKSLTVMTALGIALTVATAVFIMALLAGLGRAFATTGDPLNVLMLRKGSDSELAAGGVSRDAMQVLKDLPGVAKNSQGEPLVSGEDILVVVLPRKGGTGETNVTTRFLTPLGIEMRPKIHLIAGRWFTPGQREVVVSSSINRRFEHANIGDMVRIGKGDWPIVGIFDGSGTAHDSEIWGDINQLVTDFERTVYSSVLVRATDPGLRPSPEEPCERRSAPRTQWPAGTRLLRFANQVRCADKDRRLDCGLHHGSRLLLRRRQHHVCGRGLSRPRDCYAARDWVFTAQHSDFVHAGVAVVVLIGCGAGHLTYVAVQRHDHGNAKSGDVQRGRIQPANDASRGLQRHCVCPDHGRRRRVCSRLACIAARHT
jgi:hypothetical protein